MGTGLAILGLGLGLACKGQAPVDSVQDSSGVDTEWVDTAQEVFLESIELHPGRITVEPGAELTLRAVGVYSDGHREPLTGQAQSSDSALVTVDGLHFTALQAGSATLSLERDGVRAESLVDVQDTSTLSLQVITAAAQPVPQARVIWQGEKLIADDQGLISLPTDTGGPVSLTVFAQDPDYVPLTVYGVVSRRIYLTLSHVDELTPPGALSATVDFSSLDEADPDELRLSLSGTALAAPVLVSELDLIRPNRSVSIFGTQADVPENLALETHAPQVSLASHDAQTQVWTLAGTLPISELSSGVEGFAQIGALLEALEPTLRLDASGPTSWDSSITLTPQTPVDDQVWVTLPDATESSLVLLFGESQGAWLLQGLATGSTQVRIPSPQGGGEQRVVAWQEQGGAGSGGGRSMTMAPVVSGQAELPDWVQVPAHGGLSAATGAFTLSTDPQAVFVQAFVLSANGGMRQVLMPPGEQAASLAGEPGLSFGKTQWDVQAIHADSGHYQDILGSVGVTSTWVQGNAVAVGGLRTEIIGD